MLIGIIAITTKENVFEVVSSLYIRSSKNLKMGKYSIEERMVINAVALGHKTEKLYAINDIVID